MRTACVILNYNDPHTTIKLVDNIKTYNSITNIVIVDNCSTDESYTILTKVADEKVHVIKTDRNGGYGYGNNKGVKYAYDVLGAQYIAIANPDVEFSEQCFSSLISALVEDPRCGAVGPISLDTQRNLSKSIAWKQPSIVIEALTSSVLLSRMFKSATHYKPEYIFSHRLTCEVDVIPGSFLVVNADQFLSVGMYDEDVFLYCEEKILSRKYASKGIKTKLVTNADYIHQHSITINKNISNCIKRKDIWLNSKKKFIDDYMLADKNLRCLIDIIFAYARLESRIVGVMRRIAGQ